MTDDPDDKFDLSKLSPEQLTELRSLEERIKQWNATALLAAPARTRTFGAILRKSVHTGSLSAMRRFLRKHDFEIPRHLLSAFRDYMITQRFDLKDLEPAARARLRLRTLSTEDESDQTA